MQPPSNNDTVRCPRCGSGQILAQRRGLIGTKIDIICLKCNKRFRPGHGAGDSPGGIGCGGLILIAIVVLYVFAMLSSH